MQKIRRQQKTKNYGSMCQKTMGLYAKKQKTMGLCAKNFNENQAKILVVLKNEQGFFKCML